MRVVAGIAVAVLVVAAVVGCGDSIDTEAQFPHVVEVSISTSTAGVYDFEVTLSSPYDTPERYADAWRIVGPDGGTLGLRELAHHHGDEQPFTRSLHAVEIDPAIGQVTVEGRDSANGWGGATIVAPLP